MAKILLQTTIVDTPDDWNVGRFSPTSFGVQATT